MKIHPTLKLKQFLAISFFMIAVCSACIKPENLENRVNLLINVPPDRSGQIPEKWINPLMQLKNRMGNKI